MSGSSVPTLAGFTTFVANQMQVPSNALDPDGVDLSNAFNVAMEIVNPVLAQVSSLIYTLAVYNLAGSNLVNFAQDQPGETYFTNLRTTLEINDFVPGVISATADQNTSTSLVTTNWSKDMNIAELQYLKDPWGRQYLAFAQRYGSLWGLT